VGNVRFICENCGKEFIKRGWQATRDSCRFCSYDCYHKSTRVERVLTICPVCGKEFYRRPREVERNIRAHCSQECYHKTRIGSKISDYQKKRLAESHAARSKNNIKCKCPTCGKEFWEWPSNVKPGRINYCNNACKFSSVGFKLNASIKATGKIKSEDTLKKMSENMKAENNHMYGKPCPHVRGSWYEMPNGDKTWLRSSFEIRVANALTSLNVLWEYEPKRFNVISGTYAPDFLINGCMWWEVKGFMRSQDKAKVESFLSLYPNEKFKIIGQREIEQIEYYIKNEMCFDIGSIGTDIQNFKSKEHFAPGIGENG
jgi:hypothetical protein